MGIETPMEFWPEKADKNYRSTERMLWDATKRGISATRNWFSERTNLFEHGWSSFYGVLITPMRVPTAIRKGRKGQSSWYRVPPVEILSPEFFSGALGAGLAGYGALGNLVFGLMNTAEDKPGYLAITLGVYGLTNLASGIYEGASYLIGKRRDRK